MKTKKLNLNQIKVESFVTQIKGTETDTIVGGNTGKGCWTILCYASAACNTQENLCSVLSCSIQTINDGINGGGQIAGN